MTGSSQYLGRIINMQNGNIEIPSDVLATAQITGGQVEVLSTKEGIFIRSIDQKCELCGTNGKLNQVGNKNLCSECTEGLGLGINAE